MTAYLTTDRLTLRHFTADDADLLIELNSDPEVMRFLTGGEPIPAEVIRERGLPNILLGYRLWDGKLGLFAAFEKASGDFIGWFMISPEDEDSPVDVVELGYRLRRAAWGNGYATEGSRALLAKAFTELGVTTVWAETMTVNEASRKVLEKAGLIQTQTLETPEDMLVVEGSELGGVHFELTRDQWSRR